jgi:Zn-dependent protease
MVLMDITYIITVLVVILFSMTLHEAMHGFVAYWLGDDTAKALGRLTFNPIKHLDPFMSILLPLILAISGAPVFGGAKPVPFNPNRVRFGEWGAALVAVAGPLTNLAIAFIAFAVFAITAPGVHSGFATVLATTVMVNLGFFVFNIIPIPPLEEFGTIVVFAVVMLASPLITRFMQAATQGIIAVFGTIFGINL